MPADGYRCCRCHELLPRAAYGGLKRRSDYCRPCARTRFTADRSRRCKRNRASWARRYATNGASLVAHLLLHPCVDCGETDPVVLEFDHVRGTKAHKISDMISSRNWDAILVEIDKCVVRCANCHRKRTHKDLGWYTKGGGA